MKKDLHKLDSLIQAIEKSPEGQDRINQLEEAMAMYARQHTKERITIEQPTDDNTIKFMAISDTHFGSLYENLDVYKAAIKFAEDEGVTDILHAGDVLDGHKIYKGQEFELHQHGWDRQSKWFAKQVPLSKTVKVHFIAGNHDTSFKNQAGIEPGEALENLRPDWHFLGNDIANITFKTKNGLKYNVSMIHPGGGSSYALCFDDKTEIMTETRGWQLFKDLMQGERVATLNPETEIFEWQVPSAYTNESYNGPMYNFRARSFDLNVTPNHRMFVRRYDGTINYCRKAKEEMTHPTKSHITVDGSWQFVEAKDLADARRQQWQMTKCPKGWVGETPEYIDIPIREPKKYASTPIKHIGRLAVDDAAELIAWYVTEGYIGKKKKQLTICQSKRVNPVFHAQILDLLHRIGFPEAKGKGKDSKDITVGSVELCDWLLDQCGSGSYHKFLPIWLKNCDKSVLQLVAETMINGDGWDNLPSFCYKSESKHLRDDFSEIILKLGHGVTEGGVSVSVSTCQKHPTINAKPVIEQYEGKIYCVTVPNSVILVRRNGKAIYSGNSYRSQKIVDQWSGGTKPNMLLIGHYHKAEFIPSYRNVAIIQAGSGQSQTPFMARQALAAHVGFWYITVVPGKKCNRIRAEFIAIYK